MTLSYFADKSPNLPILRIDHFFYWKSERKWDQKSERNWDEKWFRILSFEKWLISVLTQQANDETSDINYSKFRDSLWLLLVLQGQKSTHGKTRNARDYSVGSSMHAASKHSSNPITAKKPFDKVLKLALNRHLCWLALFSFSFAILHGWNRGPDYFEHIFEWALSWDDKSVQNKGGIFTK